MMHDQNLHISFWAEASNTVVYIQNRCPHAILENITPEEVFSGNKPYLSYLCIFGCLVYFHIPKEKRTKLEPLGKKDIFIGYSDSSKAYRVYVPGSRTIEISRDVKFDKDAAFKTSKDIEESNDDSIPENDESSMIDRESGIEDNGPTISNPEENSNQLNKKRPLWARKMIEENNVVPDEVLRETKSTRIIHVMLST